MKQNGKGRACEMEVIEYIGMKHREVMNTPTSAQEHHCAVLGWHNLA
jgi:hypothetical protein